MQAIRNNQPEHEPEIFTVQFYLLVLARPIKSIREAWSVGRSSSPLRAPLA